MVACQKPDEMDYSSMHVYKADELQKIIASASKIEKVGEPSVQQSGHPMDSSVIISTTQLYRVHVDLTEDGHIVTETGSSSAARKASSGVIIITSSCEMTCTPVTPGTSCNVEGCMPTDRCGCTQGSCGNNCTTDVSCRQGLMGFGFGRTIMF